MPGARWFGYNVPFFGGPEKILSRQEDQRLIQNDLLQLLLTVPGERAMRPNFGTALRTAVFDLNDDITIDAIKQSILNAITSEEPRVVVETLVLTKVPNINQINIYLQARMRDDPTSVINIERLIDLNSSEVA